MSDLCKCGCGEIVKVGNIYILGHNRRGAIFSVDHREKLSKASKRTAPGRKLSTETKLKISVSNIGRKVSEETKRKISISRKLYLEKNPDKHPYNIIRKNGGSYPEKYYDQFLRMMGLYWFKREYQFGPYFLDFAFVKEKVDIEVDGSSHNTEKAKLRDAKRNQYMLEHGWKVWRIPVTFLRDMIKAEYNRFNDLLDR